MRIIDDHDDRLVERVEESPQSLECDRWIRQVGIQSRQFLHRTPVPHKSAVLQRRNEPAKYPTRGGVVSGERQPGKGSTATSNPLRQRMTFS